MRNTVWSLVRGTRAGRFVRSYVEGSCICAAPMVLSRSVCLPEAMRVSARAIWGVSLLPKPISCGGSVGTDHDQWQETNRMGRGRDSSSASQGVGATIIHPLRAEKEPLYRVGGWKGGVARSRSQCVWLLLS